MKLYFASTSQKKLANKSGLTVIELLVVVAILAVLIIALLLSLTTQMRKSRDARRKSDLEKIKIAFEEYYNDNGCYPDEDILDVCYSDDLKPYMMEVPCDPVTKDPYQYVPLAGDQCGGYRLLADLENNHDPVIAALGCVADCGFEPGYDYGVAVGSQVLSEAGPGAGPIGSSPSPVVSTNPSAQPSPSGPVYVHACDKNGTCNQFDLDTHPELAACHTWPTNEDCQNADCVTNVGLRCNP